jgi:hypothetical protein
MKVVKHQTHINYNEKSEEHPFIIMCSECESLDCEIHIDSRNQRHNSDAIIDKISILCKSCSNNVYLLNQ